MASGTTIAKQRMSGQNPTPEKDNKNVMAQGFAILNPKGAVSQRKRQERKCPECR